MLRFGSLLILFAAFFGTNNPCSGNNDPAYHFFAPNSTIAGRYFEPESQPDNFFLANRISIFEEVDSLPAARILMLNYSAYDSAYCEKTRSFLTKYLPKANITEFWQGGSVDLEKAIKNCHVVILPYAAKGENAVLSSFGIVLKAFVKKGGLVIFTGSHEYDVLRQFDLLDLDYGYYNSNTQYERSKIAHPITQGIPDNFKLSNYAYPLDISDPAFNALCTVNNYPVAGYKNEGSGNIVYLGMEFYYDEPVSTQILINTVLWGVKTSYAATLLTKEVSQKSTTSRDSEKKPVRATLRLGAGGVAADSVALKVFPNPFTDKAFVEIELGKSTAVTLEMTDQTGITIFPVLNKKTLAAGLHRIELPNVPVGVYFVHIKTGNTTNVRRLVKTNP